jgi:hypothetical protein
MRWAGHKARTREMKNAHRILVEKLKRRDLLGDEDNINLDPK